LSAPRTVANYSKQLTGPRRSRDQRWSTFLKNHAQAIVACDFFTAMIATFRIIYVFVALEIGSRRLIHFNTTEHPTAEWTLQQLREALPGDQEYKFLLHDRHKTFSAGLDEEVEKWNISILKSPAHTPTANAFCERLIGSIRRECLDYLMPLNETHLKRTLREWVRHYNCGRPHQSLGLVFQIQMSGDCRQTTTINQHPRTDGSSRSQYSVVCITSIDGPMLPDLVKNVSDYANFSTLWNSCAAHQMFISRSSLCQRAPDT
jgi:transposase InsO family protein